MPGWHHWLNGRESELTPGVSDGQGGLTCCDSWGCKESDTTERLDWTELSWMKIVAISFKRFHGHSAALCASNSASGHHQPMPPPETPGHSQSKSGSVSYGVTALFSWVLVCTKFFSVCPPRVCFPVLCKLCSQNPTDLKSQILLGFSVPLPDPQVGKSVVGPRTFLTVWEFPWSNSSAFCGWSPQWLCCGVINI